MQKEIEPQQLIEPSFEQKLLQSELVYSRQVTLREVLNEKGTDAVGLLDIPVNFQVRDLGNTIAYIASFPEDQASFGGSRLIQVLEGAKPIRENERQRSQDRDGVINDWIIMQERSREANPSYANKLYKDHIAPESIIKEHFEEFGQNHFTQFWDAINSFTRDRSLEKFDQGYNKLMSEEKAFAEYGLSFLQANFERLLKITYYDSSFKDDFVQFLKRRTSVTITDFLRDLRFSPGNPALSGNFTDEMKERIITYFYKQLDEDTRKKLTYRAISLFRYSSFAGTTILIDKNGNPHDCGSLTTEAISRISNDEIEIRDGGSYMRVRFELNEKTGYREKKIVRIHINPQEGEIAPVIIWETDKTDKTRKRKYFCGKISPELIQAFPDLFFPRQDTLFGQIAVAGYSDDLKLVLPTKLPLVKGGKEQDMLEPQMPVFVSLFADKYLNKSPVIAGFEALAKGNS